MINRGARATVRSICLGATALTGFVLLAQPAEAIVVAAPGTPTTARDPVNLTGVGQMIVDQQNGFVGLCTGTLINPRTVVFAAHCVNDRAADTYGSANGGRPIGFGFSNSNNTAGASAFGGWLSSGHQTDASRAMYNVNQVTYNPESLEPGAAGFLYGDVALATLDTAAVNIPTWSMLFSPLPAPSAITAAGTGYHVAFSGYGNNGTGTTGSTGGIDYRRRTAANMLGALASLDNFENFLFGGSSTANPMNLYWIDFDDPNRGTATPPSAFDFNAWRDNAVANEGMTANADSGAPLILDQTFSKPVVIGVQAGGYTRFFPTQPANGYGTAAFFQPLYLYWDWIADNNPYHYVSANAGDGDWTDPTHWVTLLDPAYQIIDGNGQLVNGVPAALGDGKLGSSGQFGQACFESGGNSQCKDMATGIQTNETKPIGTSGSEPVPSAFLTKLEDAVPTAGAVSTPTLSNGLAGATNFSPVNVDGTPSVAAQYFDVTLSAAGTTTLSGASVSIDRLAIIGSDAKLVIASSGTLSTNIDTTITAGTLQADGAYSSAGDIAVLGGILSGSSTVTAPFITSIAGIIAPGTATTAGTLTLAGNLVLSSASGVLINMAPSAQDHLQVNGTATIDGVLGIDFASGIYNYLTPYTLITSTGALTGTFNSLMLSNLIGATAAITYDANNVFLTLDPLDARWSATPGSGDWNTASNWQYGFIPRTTDKVVFAATTGATVSITQASVGKSLEFEAAAPAYTFAITGSSSGAASLTISEGITNASSNAPIFTVSGVSGNAGTFAFTGTGNAANATITAGNFGTVSFSGNTDAGSSAALVAQGSGQIDFSGTTGAAGDNQISAGSIGGSGTFKLGANTLTVGALGSDTIVSGVISGTGGLTKVGTGMLTLSGANTYEGTTLISAGTLQVGNGGASGDLNGPVVNNGILIVNRSDNIEASDGVSGTGSIEKKGAGILTLTGANTYTGGTTITAGTLQIGNGGTTGSVTGNITDNAALIFNRSNNLMFSGVISGTGTLTKQGAAALILTGNNTYTGVTTISGGVLQIGANGATGSISSASVVNNATIAFNRTDAVIYSGVISGTGALMKANTNTLTLTGANTYTGTTTIGAGTLQIGNGGTTGSVASASIVDNATLAFNRTNSITYSGVVSGTGNLVQAGTGTLILTGANTYTGGTTISAGTLQIGDSGTTGSIAGNVANSGTLRFQRSNDLTFAGVISGTGAVVKAGAGTLALSGTNTYTGATTISAGTLVVSGAIGSSAVTAQSGTLLAGTGTVGATTVASGGTLAPGSIGGVGTLTVNGALTLASGSSLLIDANSATADRLTVSGALAAGGTLTVSGIGSYVPRFGDSVVIATASSITGFSNITDNITGALKPTVNIGAITGGQQAVLTVGADSFLTQFTSTSDDQTLIATLLDQARSGNSGGLTGLYDVIDYLTGDELNEAFDNLAPDVQRALGLMLQLGSQGSINMLNERLTDIGGTPGGVSASGFRLDGTGLANALNSISSYGADAQSFVAMGTQLASGPAGSFSNLGVTPNPAQGGAASMIALPGGMGGFLTGGSLNGTVRVGGGGGQGRVRGFIVGGGLDFPVADGFTVGGTVSLGESDTVLQQSPGSVDSDFIQGAIYGRYDGDNNFFATAFVSVTSNTIETERTSVVGTASFTESGSTDGKTPSFGVTVGKNYNVPMVGDYALTVIPSFGVQYRRSTVDAYTETGGPTAMTFSEYSDDSFSGRLAVDIKAGIDLFGLHLMPSAHLAWVQDFLGENSAVEAGFADVPTVTGAFTAAQRSRMYGEVGIGTDIDLGAVFGTPGALSVRYNSTLGREDLSYNSWMGSLKLRF